MISDWHKYFEYDEECESCLKWKVEIRHGGLLLAVPGQMAGTRFNRLYHRVQLNKKIYTVHLIIWEMFNGSIDTGLQVDHKDIDKSNNRLGNLRLVTRQVNCRNRPLRRDSSTGINGVTRRVRTMPAGSVHESWIARYLPLDGERISKEFSIKKFGEDRAKELALDWLRTVKEVNSHTDMYAENHGK